MALRHYVFICLVTLWVSACVPYKAIVNYKQSAHLFSTPQTITNYKPIRIQPGDILHIEIGSLESDVVSFFNEYQESGYMVSSDGNIDFPLLGKVRLTGYTTEEGKAKLLKDLNKYFVKPPVINMRVMNFKINVNGEVNSPGNFTVDNERISIIEAITLAGDFTSYARRDSILIIREDGNMRSFGYVNFYSSEILNSPYFYLRQNDVVYVKPDKSKLGTIRDRESKVLPYVTVGISLVLLTLTIFRLR